MDAKTKQDLKSQEMQRAMPIHALSPFDEMERMFESMFHNGWMRPMRSAMGEMPLGGRMPRVDVIDREAEIVVRAEVPGVDKKDIEVSTTESTVTIKGTTQREEKEEKGDYCRCEISHGAFTRTVALPGEVDSSRAKANFKDGVLELVLPKIEKSKRHTITIQ